MTREEEIRARCEKWNELNDGTLAKRVLSKALAREDIPYLLDRLEFMTEAYDRNATVHEALTRDYLAVKAERSRLKARLEAAVSDMEALADREADPCDFCNSKGACHRPDSRPRAGYRNFKWRGSQEGANQ